MGAVLRRTALAAAVAAAGGCGPSGVQLPPVPTQIESTAAVYDTPTGTVPANATAQIAELQQTLDTINATQIGSIVSNFLVSLRARLDGSGLPIDPVTTPRRNHPVIIGSVTLDRICRGWDASSTTPDAANGTINITAVYQSGSLEKVVWGTATACHERVDVTPSVSVNAYLDGSFAVYLEGPLTADPTQAMYLLGWNGTIGTDSTQVSTTFDFRVVPPQIEVRLGVPDGDIIGSLGANEVSLRGTNGTFGCSLQTFDCNLPQVARGAPPGL
jgi:hypothetical protein